MALSRPWQEVWHDLVRGIVPSREGAQTRSLVFRSWLSGHAKTLQDKLQVGRGHAAHEEAFRGGEHGSRARWRMWLGLGHNARVLLAQAGGYPVSLAVAKRAWGALRPWAGSKVL